MNTYGNVNYIEILTIFKFYRIILFVEGGVDFLLSL